MAHEQIRVLFTLATEQGFPHWLAAGTMVRGWMLLKQGQGEEGVRQLRQGLAAWRALGTGLDQSYYLALLAEAYGKVGLAEEGLTVLAEALTVVEQTGERLYEAELYQLKGQLTLQCKLQNVKFPTLSGSRGVFSQSHSPYPSPEGEVARTAGGELESSAAKTKREKTGRPDASGDLWLVH